MKEITLKRFIAHFGENLRKEKRFCFILGAGASKTSGIPTGGELVQQWIKELKESDEEDLRKWLKEKAINEDDLASHYSDIFDKRFEFSKKDGFAFLEKAMEGVEPSCGYSVLAQILANGKHNIVITTNFDSLTEDALFIYTQKKPLVIGHASLADYISTNLTRPIIIKIHHDLFFSPKNGVDDVGCLDKNFSKNLKDIFKYYTPLVIGYGGNDGSLMSFLEELDHFEESIFWFYIEGNRPKERIINLIKKVSGKFVPIKGFDDLMIQLGDKLELQKLDTEIEKIAKNRADNYRKQIENITKDTTDTETKEAMTSITSRGEKTWWNYELLASDEKDKDKANEIYLQGIEKFPVSSELLNNYANFLKRIRKKYDEAEKYYLKALEISPEYAVINVNYALLLKDIKKQCDDAEKYYLKALKTAPENAFINGSYANFLCDIRKLYDEAEKYHLKALKLEPGDANIHGNYAKLLIICNKRDEAIEYINKAFELNKNAENDLALELWFYCYAVFPKTYPQSKAKIEELLAKGIQSIGWDLSEIMKIAEKEKHPDYEQLIEFEKRITQYKKP